MFWQECLNVTDKKNSLIHSSVEVYYMLLDTFFWAAAQRERAGFFDTCIRCKRTSMPTHYRPMIAIKTC